MTVHGTIECGVDITGTPLPGARHEVIRTMTLLEGSRVAAMSYTFDRDVTEGDVLGHPALRSFVGCGLFRLAAVTLGRCAVFERVTP